METQFIIWTIVALIGAAALIWRIASSYHAQQHRLKPRHRLITRAHESEEFFAPGDRIVKNDYDYDEADDM